jgi:hypothetical protein
MATVTGRQLESWRGKSIGLLDERFSRPHRARAALDYPHQAAFGQRRSLCCSMRLLTSVALQSVHPSDNCVTEPNRAATV